MLAEQVMILDPHTAHIDELIEKVIVRMRSARLRMLPVTDHSRVVLGVISTFSILEHIIPNYLVSGDLNQISFAPDAGILRRQYNTCTDKQVSEVMDPKPAGDMLDQLQTLKQNDGNDA